MRIAVFGMGYVGVVSSACLAEMGHEVIGVDVNPMKVRLINERKSPIIELGLEKLIDEKVRSGKLRATGSVAEAVAQADVSFISVGTPSDRSGAPSMAAVERVVREIGGALRGSHQPHTVVMRSTVPPGTSDQLIEPLLTEHSGRSMGDTLAVCSNPEFLREGSAIRDFRLPAFTLIGTRSELGRSTMRQLYANLDAPIIATDPRVAESVKYLCNVFHALKISFANEAGVLLQSLGVDSRETMRIFCEDRVLNISPAYLRPGYAFGGSCLPKDLRAVLAFARANDVDLPLLNQIQVTNDRHIERAFETIARGGRRRVAQFGLAFKPGTDDLRESPLVRLAERLIGKGYPIAIYDRYVEAARLVGSNREFIDSEIPHFERLMASTPEHALADAEVIVIGHAGPEETAAIVRAAGGRTIVDLQGNREIEALNGIDYHGICW
ncbi:MAG: UDP-glucose dehydrogenase family protein [Burkholderiales bacterium]